LEIIYKMLEGSPGDGKEVVRKKDKKKFEKKFEKSLKTRLKILPASIILVYCIGSNMG
jgi:hypothetical protein